MGLTNKSVGTGAIDNGLIIKKETSSDRVIALVGNPNVGKSTVFNELTGLHQHTGNWPGKTVSTAQGVCNYRGTDYIFVDLPGCYSLLAHSAEEEVARDFICFESPDAAVVVCDATCLERNLNLVLQVLEIIPKTIVCINLSDEAERKGIYINTSKLSELLCTPVIQTSARDGAGLENLLDKLIYISCSDSVHCSPLVKYDPFIEGALEQLIPVVNEVTNGKINSRWLSLRLLDLDDSLEKSLYRFLGFDILDDPQVSKKLTEVQNYFKSNGISERSIKDSIIESIILRAEKIYKSTVSVAKESYNARDIKIDRILTSKLTGFPIMFFMLIAIFWLTITGANYPSQLLNNLFTRLEVFLFNSMSDVGIPLWINDMLIGGVYRVLTWVISVMLPPMAIFFPLFTLLEDLGYLPRVAFNLDKIFKKCNACGKQALTMCMGFGCNAAGVVGCRIIESPRERLIAILTNNFVPCNGRFPTLIAIISMFFIGSGFGIFSSAVSSLFLALIVLLGLIATFLVSKLLSSTILKGIPSSFTLELPPYRKPQLGKVIIRSIFDRTIFVLGRAAAVAAPAGLLIWIISNINVGEISLLSYLANFIDPFAKIFGLDGVILIAFILGIPANEIVLPIIIMAYMSEGNLMQIEDLSMVRQLLLDNGWTWLTALNVMLFSLMHWPCSTTLITIKKESGSWKWTAAAFAIPAICGFLLCFMSTSIFRIFS